VSNASAYVTKNLSNFRKGVDDMRRPQTRQASVPPRPRARGPSIAHELLDRWRSHLDEKALTALLEAGPDISKHVLSEMDLKGAGVRNPSAYVMRSIENSRESQATSQALRPQVHVGPVAGASLRPAQVSDGGFAAGFAAGKIAATLDEEAQVALQELELTVAASILDSLTRTVVSDPSAYVLRAIHRVHDEEVEPDVLGQWAGVLDEDAANGLRQLDPRVAECIVNELDSKGDSVRNPSAYVVRAISNARKGQVFGADDLTSRGPTGHKAELVPSALEVATERFQLDSRASAALQELGEEAAAGILLNLESKGVAINNPSAWVLKSVGNEKKRVWGSPPVKRARLEAL